jgi:hypothetical protein
MRLTANKLAIAATCFVLGIIAAESAHKLLSHHSQRVMIGEPEPDHPTAPGTRSDDQLLVTKSQEFMNQAGHAWIEAKDEAAKTAKGGPEKLPNGRPAIIIAAVDREYSRTPEALTITVKPDDEAALDGSAVRVQVFLYDSDARTKAIKLTDGQVSYDWLTPHRNWTDSTPKLLRVYCSRSPGKTDRQYFGYLVRVYYRDKLISYRAEPHQLAEMFPPPQEYRVAVP